MLTARAEVVGDPSSVQTIQIEENSSGIVPVTGDQPEGFTVPMGQTWEIVGTVTTPKNVIVHGTLRMRPGATLRFRDVNESLFVGSGLEVLDSDVGLWVVDHGVLDAVGTPRVGWNRTGDDPSWLETDELKQVPSAVGDWQSFPPHPKGITPAFIPEANTNVEVLNLTRDVVIEGTPGGRAHTVFLHTHMPQTVQHVLFRHLGPRKNGAVVEGRWPVHFHHCMDASRGSLVEGVVVREVGSHAFVPHLSHGVTFRDCIAYNVTETPFWWDDGDETDDVLYERS